MTSKPTPQKKRVSLKAWAVLTADGKWSEQVSANMSPELQKFYQKSAERGIVQFVPCTISYSMPLKKNRPPKKR